MSRWMSQALCVACLAMPAMVMAEGRYQHDTRSHRGQDAYDIGPYIGVNIGQLRYEEDQLDTINPTAVTATLGVQLHPNIAVEGRIGGGLGRHEFHSYDVEVRSMYAGYIKGIVPLSPVFSIYGLGGIAGLDLKRDFGEPRTRDNGFSYGIGMDFNLPRGARINVEYTRLLSGVNDGYDYNVNMGSVGVAFRF